MKNNPESSHDRPNDVFDPELIEKLTDSVFGSRTTLYAAQVSGGISGLSETYPDFNENLRKLSDVARGVLETDVEAGNDHNKYLRESIFQILNQLPVRTDIRSSIVGFFSSVEKDIENGKLIEARDKMIDFIQGAPEFIADDMQKKDVELIKNYIKSIFNCIIATPISGERDMIRQVEDLAFKSRISMTAVLDIWHIGKNAISAKPEKHETGSKEKIFDAMLQTGLELIDKGDAENLKNASELFHRMALLPVFPRRNAVFITAWMKAVRKLGKYKYAKSIYEWASAYVGDNKNVIEEVIMAFSQEARSRTNLDLRQISNIIDKARRDTMEFTRSCGIDIQEDEFSFSGKISQDQETEDMVIQDITTEQRYHSLRNLGIYAYKEGKPETALLMLKIASEFSMADADPVIWKRLSSANETLSRYKHELPEKEAHKEAVIGVLNTAISRGIRSKAFMAYYFSLLLSTIEEKDKKQTLGKMKENLMKSGVSDSELKDVLRFISGVYEIEDADDIISRDEKLHEESLISYNETDKTLLQNREFVMEMEEAQKMIGNPNSYIAQIAKALEKLNDPALIMSSQVYGGVLNELKAAFIAGKKEKERYDAMKQFKEYVSKLGFEVSAVAEHLLGINEEFKKLLKEAEKELGKEKINYSAMIDTYRKAFEKLNKKNIDFIYDTKFKYLLIQGGVIELAFGSYDAERMEDRTNYGRNFHTFINDELGVDKDVKGVQDMGEELWFEMMSDEGDEPVGGVAYELGQKTD